MSKPSIAVSNVLFCEFGTSGDGGDFVATIGGQLRPVALVGTPIPGRNETFAGFTPFEEISGGNVAINGFGPATTASQYKGVFTDIGGLHAVADTNTPIPGGIGNFIDFGGLSFNDGHIVFLGFGSGGQAGYYTDMGGHLRVVVDTKTPIPGGSGTFTIFDPFRGPSLSKNRILFLAGGAENQFGLYLDINGSLTRVISNADTLDGKSFFPFAPYISIRSLDGDQLAFQILFSDQSEGVYVTTFPVGPSPTGVPTLSEWGMVIMALLLMATGMMFILRFELTITGTAVAGSATQFERRTSQPLFAPRVFGKVLIWMLSAVLLGFAIVIGLFGSVSATDIGGTLVCALIISYLVHLLVTAGDLRAKRK